MSISRRDFIQRSVIASAALVPVAQAFSARPSRQGQPAGTPGGGKRVLILGGTGFLGPACMEAALARGHKVTLFNRGRIEQRRKELGRPLDIPEGVEILYGNRDPNKTADEWKPEDKRGEASPKGLESLKGKAWDAVIDTSGYFPRMVKASAELLAPSVAQYVFISTISVYAKNDTPGMDETAELATLSDPNTEEMGAGGENYGAGKAACEKAAEAAMPGRTTVIRPGFIVGRRDSTARFMYWPLRARRGGEVLLPGTEADPVQLIDVRDLAAWTIKCIEDRTTGVYNATGPATELTQRAFIDGVAKGAAAEVKPAFVPWEFLQEQGLQIGALPLMVPPTGESAGFHRVSVKRAIDKGLTFRPLEDTTRDALAWFDQLTDQGKQAAGRAMLTPEREAEIIAAWAAKPR